MFAPTPMPQPINTPRPTSTPIAIQAPASKTNAVANLRAGPGTDYTLTGQLAAGSPVQPTGRNPAGTWLQLDTGKWIWGTLVDHAHLSLPVVDL